VKLAAFAATVLLHVGHGLSVAVPPGWHVTTQRFTPCADPIERFSVIRGKQMLMVQERLKPVPAELHVRAAHLRVRGAPTAMECCSIGSRKGWSLQFGENGRAFYAFVYPGGEDPQPLLQILDSLHAG
jgi:hypothetical protein